MGLVVALGSPSATLSSSQQRLALRQTPYAAPSPAQLRQPVYVCKQTRDHLDIDGYLSEWSAAPSIQLGKGAVVRIAGYRGEADLSARVRFLWDRDSLYVAAAVNDDEHIQKHDSGFLYMDDSLLVGFDGLGDAETAELDDDDYVYGFADGSWSDPVWRYEAPAVIARRSARNIRLACRRTGRTTRYECAIPWSELSPMMPLAQSTCRFSVLVSDRDASTSRRRHEYLAWTRGLAEPRDPRLFGTMVFEPAKPRAYQSLEVFPQLTQRVVDRGDDLAAEIAFNASREETQVLQVALCSKAKQHALLSQELQLPKGPSRLTVDCRLKDLPEGQYRLLVSAPRSDEWFHERVTLPFVKFNSAALLDRLDRVEERARTRAGAADAATDLLVRSRAATELLVSGRRRGMVPATLSLVEEILTDAETLAAGDATALLDRGVGWVSRGYRSAIDDSIQPYVMRVPDDYDPARRYPLYVSLHYLDSSLTSAGWVASQYNRGWSMETRNLPTRPTMLELHPFGRGNNWYRGLGEDDVVQALASAKQHYSIDPDRVYLTGTSMGGTGAWYIAARHPDLFAGVAIVSGHMEYAYDNSREFGDDTTPLWPRSFLQGGSPYFLAANLFNLPVLCHHGQKDTIVPVYQSQTMVRKLRELKYPVEYEEHSLVGHSGFSSTLDDDIRRWLLKHRRDPCPKRIVVRTNTLEHNQIAWLRIDRLEQMYQFAQLQAEVKDSTLDAFAWGVREFTLLPPEALFKPGDPIRVNVMRNLAWEGRLPDPPELTLKRVEGTETSWTLAPEGPTWRQPGAPLMKRHGLQGPVADLYNTRMVIVYGTQADEATTTLLKREAELDRDRVNRWFSASFRAIADTEVTRKRIEDSSLLLYGGPAENALTAKIAADLPIRLDDAALVIGDRRIPGGDVGTKFIYPNPLNPDRYVVVNMGVLPSALRGAGSIPWGLWDPLPDYLVFRARPTPAPGRNSTPPEVWDFELPERLVEGMFDDAWQVMEDSPLVVWHEKP